MNNSQIVKIGEVKQLLKDGKKVKVKTINNEFTEITKFIEKGILKTYKIVLENGKSIKVSKDHLFFTDTGWVKCKDIIINTHKILNDDDKYYSVISKEYIGDERIVDISVIHSDRCYFGNGMLHHNSGKSLIGSHLLASTQRKGGIAVYIDTESAVSPEFLEAIGVDTSNMLYVHLETVEEIFDTIETIVTKIRESNKDKLVTILVDSLAAASTKVEMDADYDKDGWATTKAIVISKAMRKITQMIARQQVALVFTNQLRQKLGVMFGDPWCVDPETTNIKIRYDKDSPFFDEYHNKLQQITQENTDDRKNS